MESYAEQRKSVQKISLPEREGVVETSISCNKVWKPCNTAVPYLTLEVYKILSFKK